MGRTNLDFKLPIVSIGLFLSLFSCTTFTIPVASLKTQITEAHQANSKIVEVNNPLSKDAITYLSNNIDSLIVVGKDSERYVVANSPSLEMRVTELNGKRHILYFDTVTIEDNILIASPSRLLSGKRSKIHLDNIAKIEIQDGKKNFRYLQN